MMGSRESTKKPIQTQQRWGRLASVFSAQSGKELHALIAGACVLFEDLRIEIAGMSASDLGGLDECGKNGRRLYFQRRSMATLHEFTIAIEELDKLPSFQTIRERFSKIAQRHWKQALTYFRKHERYVARMRHHVGGHFGSQAAELAVQNLLPDVFGSLEIAHYESGRGGAKLFFASEIAATAVLRHVKGDGNQAKARKMMRRAIVGYRHAVRAVDCIIATYLWGRFGH
ncbi:MAG: hypothetical protein JWO19_5854 [Bryobacterales bacterium]|nr:hypothetical protein [Bryobacterales bacterium]